MLKEIKVTKLKHILLTPTENRLSNKI